jgi:hypothetical protein
MTVIEAGLTIKFTNLEEESRNARPYVSATLPASEGGSRSAFWEPRTSSTIGISHYGGEEGFREPYQEVDYWEEKVNSQFGKNLGAAMLNALSRQLNPGGIWDRESHTALSISSSAQEIPAYSELLNRYAELSLVLFQARITSYSSMTVGLTIAGVEHLVRAFNSDFESFRIFLEGFIHPAYEDIVGERFANQLRSVLTPSAQLISEFNAPSAPLPSSPSVPPASDKTPPTETRASQAAEKARFAWILANTSLVIPVLLALVVLFVAFQEMNVARTQYNTAIQSLLEYQTKLLEEDRARLATYSAIQDFLIRESLHITTTAPLSVAPISVNPIVTTSTPSP